jgi:hypothetical protein
MGSFHYHHTSDEDSVHGFQIEFLEDAASASIMTKIQKRSWRTVENER